jgi:hypothetical protein
MAKAKAKANENVHQKIKTFIFCAKVERVSEQPSQEKFKCVHCELDFKNGKEFNKHPQKALMTIGIMFRLLEKGEDAEDSTFNSMRLLENFLKKTVVSTVKDQITAEDKASIATVKAFWQKVQANPHKNFQNLVEDKESGTTLGFVLECGSAQCKHCKEYVVRDGYDLKRHNNTKHDGTIVGLAPRDTTTGYGHKKGERTQPLKRKMGGAPEVQDGKWQKLNITDRLKVNDTRAEGTSVSLVTNMDGHIAVKHDKEVDNPDITTKDADNEIVDNVETKVSSVTEEVETTHATSVVPELNSEMRMQNIHPSIEITPMTVIKSETFEEVMSGLDTLNYTASLPLGSHTPQQGKGKKVISFREAVQVAVSITTRYSSSIRLAEESSHAELAAAKEARARARDAIRQGSLQSSQRQAVKRLDKGSH